MKIITDGKSLYKLKQSCNKDEVLEAYTKLCNSSPRNLKYYWKCLNPFVLPLSFIMFNYGEFSLKGEDAKKAKRLRRLWHDIRWFEEEICNNLQTNNKLHLDNHDTKLVLLIASHYNVEINTY